MKKIPALRGKDVPLQVYIKRQLYRIFPAVEAPYVYEEVMELLERYEIPDIEAAQEAINTVVRRAKGKD